MCLSGTLPWIRGGFLFVAQMISGIVAAAVVSALFPGPLAVNTILSHGTSVRQGLFIEMFLTAELLITVLMLAAEKTKATFLAPIGIGLSLFVAELTGTSFILYLQPGFLFAETTNRCLLYRRFPQPNPIFRALCRQQGLPALPLDLLARALPRRPLGIWLLSICQALGLRECQSRTGQRGAESRALSLDRSCGSHYLLNEHKEHGSQLYAHLVHG